ncbi:Crp/Fnr family transcriptional regulator [Mongoliitalea daihaiensis]|uniref:Crp/Fnr family transcriptional regulator n=1 Tax=Mongoliitalea daihaiensis TaxID=2782006 RepID=UPI001F2FEDEA|nr:Crp/Fnr family transcriptional regulator [Mongoliitalea daihaiensis]UJP64891.1 Crp/Fnr family transcriptional regulator [Mongoliitalea daihaiensis]
MFDRLKKYCESFISLTESEAELIDTYFEVKELKKKEYLLQEGTICNFIGFIANGTIRHFHIKDGVERTCDISFQNAWVTDFQSFLNNLPCVINLQAMEDTTIYLVKKENLFKLYNDCPKYETFGRLMAEQVAQRATEIAMSLSSEKPEERFQNLLKKQPDLFQKVPQKYIANFLGISPESLSRIQKRIHTKRKS